MTSQASDRVPFGEWPGWARISTYVAAGLVLLLVVGVVAGVVVARRPLPQTEGVLHLHGLTHDVDVVRDAHGIPQLYADDPGDLFFAQGFVQAQDRFFQMDFRRHVTAGRLSELFGRTTLPADMYIRTMGWRRVAAQELELVSPTTRSHLDSFSAGVNAYLQGRSATALSLEYTVLGLDGLDYRPEKWTAVDSLAWLKAMAWDLRGNMDDEVARARLTVDKTAEQVAELYPTYPYRQHQPIVPDSSTSAPGTAPRPAFGRAELTALAGVRRGVDALPDLMGRGDGIGSNSWVVSGAHTASGKPLLANDPHLGTSLPGVWYQMGLHCRTVDASCPYDVSGFTFAGMPGVVIGHNQSIAWGMTNLDPDVTDLFLEKVSGHSYLYGGRELPLSEHDETIRVRGGVDRTITVRSTRHGPLLSDVSPELSSVGANAQVPSGSPTRGNGYAVALDWTALTPRPTADAVFGIDRATDWAEFREAARSFAVPSQNLVYADTSGNIGYQAPGDIPIRKGGRTGDYPVAGWLPKNDWTGRFVPYDDLPSVLNPTEGFIVTANQAVTGRDYPWFLGDSWDQGYRSQRIRDLLTSAIGRGRKLGVTDMTRLQLDSRNPVAAVLLPYLLRQLPTSGYYADGQRLLVGWDGSQSADSPAAAYFNAVWSNLLRLTFEDQLPTNLQPDGNQRWVAVMSRLLRHPESLWWDDARTQGVVEDRDQVLGEAMRDARDELTRREAESANRWTWGRLHSLTLKHPAFGHVGFWPLRALFDRGPYPVAGGSAAVDAASWDASEGYAVTTAPSMRMVVDLGDLDDSRWVDLTGVSGHVASPHFQDQFRLWQHGKSLPWAFDEQAVKAAADETLTLEPAS